MKSKGNDNLLESSSEESVSEDDEEAWKLTEEVEKEFFKTLSQIKSKDPKIYKKNTDFFKDVSIPENKPKGKTKSKPLTLRDYERKIVIEKGGELSDEEPVPEEGEREQPTYVKEQESLKNSFKAFIQSDTEDDESEWGGLFHKREKTKEEKEAEEEHYKEWLKGQKNEPPSEEVAKEMKPLRDFWADPDLNKEDQFLRDFILNKRFLEHDDKVDNRAHEESLLTEPEEDDNQDRLENKYSHRFEEPDQEFIKRYPREMLNSVRRKDDRRKRNREEVKERKVKEKEKKRAEIRQKQKIKKQEIEQKLEELKTLTGNNQLAFENVLNKDFDIDEHDKAMQRLFNEEFYSQDDPTFNLDDSAGYEGDGWNEGMEEDPGEYFGSNEELTCEDPNFIMDCDYDPTLDKPKDKTSRSRRRKDKHRRTTVSEAVKRDKPLFDPTAHKSFQEYLDQYYAIDCEDFIGDLPCRFKYRRTVPNSYGLTIEEILAADPKELESWCSINRIRKLKPEYQERGDFKVFSKKATNEELKRKVLPSLYKKADEEKLVNQEELNTLESSKKSVNKKNIERDFTDNTNGDGSGDKSESKSSLSNSLKKKKKKKSGVPSGDSHETTEGDNNLSKRKRKSNTSDMTDRKKKKNFHSHKDLQQLNRISKQKKNNVNKLADQNKLSEKSSLFEMSDARLQAYGFKPKKFRNKLKYKKV